MRRLFMLAVCRRFFFGFLSPDAKCQIIINKNSLIVRNFCLYLFSLSFCKLDETDSIFSFFFRFSSILFIYFFLVSSCYFFTPRLFLKIILLRPWHCSSARRLTVCLCEISHGLSDYFPLCWIVCLSN